MKLDIIGKSKVTLNTAVSTKTMSLTTKQWMIRDRNWKYKVNLEMIVTKEETNSLQAIFVKRAVILNDNRIETGYHWKK